MSKQESKIGYVTHLSVPTLGGSIYHGDLKEKRSEGIEYSTDLALPKKNFWDKLGDTVRGKNNLGKVIYGVGTIAVSMTTGYNIQPITDIITQKTTIQSMELFSDISIWSLIFAAAAIALGYFKSKVDSDLKAVLEQARIGFNMVSEYKKKSSDGGEKVTEGEKDLLLAQAQKLFAAIINAIQPKIFGK